MSMVSVVRRLVEKHKLIRRLMVLWSVVLITWVVVIVFTRPPDIPAGTVTALSLVVGMLGSVIGFYKWLRHKDDGVNQDQGESGQDDRHA